MLDGRSTIAGPESSGLIENLPAAISDIGCEREINEDRYAVIDSPAGRAWIVCDGMGGSLGGDLAAQLAIDAIRRALETRRYGSITEALRGAVDEANRVIVLRRQNPAFNSMGTTVVIALVSGDELVIGHAGDSRAYLVHDGEVEQITVDHTYVQDLVDRGSITLEEALSHPHAHVLTRCLGAEPRLNLDTHPFWIWENPPEASEDILILCSDGLYSLISEQEMAEVIRSCPPQEACMRLVELSKSRGGFDNITCVILPVGGALRREAPDGPRPSKPRVAVRRVSAPIVPRSREAVWKQLVIGAFCLVFGMLGLAFLLFMQLGKDLQ